MIGAAPNDLPIRRVQIAVVHPMDPEETKIGGINAFIRGMVKFAPDDFDFAVIGISATRPLRRWADVELAGRPVRFMPVLRLGARGRVAVPLALRFTTALALARRRMKLDRWIFSVHRPGIDIALGRSRAMWRVVHLSVDDLNSAGSTSRWRVSRRLLHFVERRSFGRMDRVFIVNTTVANHYKRRFPEVASRFDFLPNWVDSTTFRPFPDEQRRRLREQLRQDLSLGAGPLVLFAGRLEEQKDPVLAVEALQALRSRRPDVQLLMAGEGSLESRIRPLAGVGLTAVPVRLLGAVEPARLAQLMNASDVLLLTSRFETGPTVGLEALATGLPVVTTNVGEVAGVVARHGAGATVDARIPAVLASALDEVLTRSPRPTDARAVAMAAAEPYMAEGVLQQLYEYNRGFAERLSGPSTAARSGPR